MIVEKKKLLKEVWHPSKLSNSLLMTSTCLRVPKFNQVILMLDSSNVAIKQDGILESITSASVAKPEATTAL